jgi:hypothetical protein
MWFGLIPSDLPGSWPYEDLKLLAPNCPLCDGVGLLLVGAQLIPAAFCADDTCQAFSWDPTASADELRDETRTAWHEVGWEASVWDWLEGS